MRLLVLALLFAFPLKAELQSILDEQELEKMTLAFSKEDLLFQERVHPSTLSGSEAFSIALYTLKNDDNDIESPKSLFHEEGQNLIAGLNRKSAELFLIDTQDAQAEMQPEHGESSIDSWIFCLSLPEFSDHLFWIIVGRQKDNRSAYVYGFN